MPIPSLARRLSLLVAVCGLVLAAACGGTHDSKPRATVAGADPAFRPATSEVASRALASVRALYQTRGGEIESREVDGRFRLTGENEFVPADVTYLSGKVEGLLDVSRPLADRLDQGIEAVTVLIAGFRTTEMSEFGIAAHDVLDYVRAVAEAPGETSVSADFKTARVASLEQQLKALETSCTCR